MCGRGGWRSWRRRLGAWPPSPLPSSSPSPLYPRQRSFQVSLFPYLIKLSVSKAICRLPWILIESSSKNLFIALASIFSKIVNTKTYGTNQEVDLKLNNAIEAITSLKPRCRCLFERILYLYLFVFYLLIVLGQIQALPRFGWQMKKIPLSYGICFRKYEKIKSIFPG